MGAAAGMAWLLRGGYGVASMAICSMIGDVAGMICDGVIEQLRDEGLDVGRGRLQGGAGWRSTTRA